MDITYSQLIKIAVILSVILLLDLIIVLILCFAGRRNDRYDERGFNSKRIHMNGTRYDDNGYNYYGYDQSGYNKDGFDKNGFDHEGYNRNGYNFYGYDREGYNKNGYNVKGLDREGYNTFGYNKYGKSKNGKYDRYYDAFSFEKDGLRSMDEFPVALTDHSIERFSERLGITKRLDMQRSAIDAYRYGKSRRQLKKTSAALVDEIENRHENGTVLIYRNYIYIFSETNALITLYRNENIPL